MNAEPSDILSQTVNMVKGNMSRKEDVTATCLERQERGVQFSETWSREESLNPDHLQTRLRISNVKNGQKISNDSDEE